jgi:hypothetical protein
MNLQEFVRDSIFQIVAGIADAREACVKYDVIIGSDGVYGYTAAAQIITDEHNRTVSQVEFDIALAQGDSKDTKGGIGVFLGTVGVGSQGASHGEKSTHSRLKFSVPVVFPGRKTQSGPGIA